VQVGIQVGDDLAHLDAVAGDEFGTRYVDPIVNVDPVLGCAPRARVGQCALASLGIEYGVGASVGESSRALVNEPGGRRVLLLAANQRVFRG